MLSVLWAFPHASRLKEKNQKKARREKEKKGTKRGEKRRGEGGDEKKSRRIRTIREHPTHHPLPPPSLPAPPPTPAWASAAAAAEKSRGYTLDNAGYVGYISPTTAYHHGTVILILIYATKLRFFMVRNTKEGERHTPDYSLPKSEIECGTARLPGRRSVSSSTEHTISTFCRSDQYYSDGFASAPPPRRDCSSVNKSACPVVPVVPVVPLSASHLVQSLHSET